MSESSKSSPLATTSWTRRPPKPAAKKKKLVAGRELRDRSGRKVYVELSTDEDEDYLFDNEEDEKEEDIKEEGEEYPDDDLAEEEEEEEVKVQQPKTRTITLKFKSEVLRELSQGSQPPEPNGAKHLGEDEDDDLDPAADVEDLEAEVQDLKATAGLVQADEEDDDDEGGPRKLTRRVTRQASLSRPEPTRPVHGRKGVARQNRSSENQNPNGTRSSPDSSRRGTMKDRLRKELRRPSREEKPKKKKAKISESEFEDEGDEPDDDVSISSEKAVESEEDYSSGPSRRHSRKAAAAPSRGRPKRSRHVSDDDETSDDAIDELEAELREIGAEIPQRRRQLRPTERMNYFIPPPPGKDDIFLPPTEAGKKRPGTGRGYGGFGGFGGDFSNLGLGDRFRGMAGLGTAGGAEDSSDSVICFHGCVLMDRMTTRGSDGPARHWEVSYRPAEEYQVFLEHQPTLENTPPRAV